MKTILFQGDSITDGGRCEDWYLKFGIGYPLLVSAELGFLYPNEYNFVNRGISGNRVLDLYSRIVRDILNVKPDYLSILIGVNDIWHSIGPDPNGTGIERYRKVYDILLAELREELPDTKIMILEPFVLRCPGTDDCEEEPNRWKILNSGVRETAKISKELAEKYKLKFIPLQEKFDKALESAPAEYWIGDGIHPTAKGHELIKREWIKAFNEIK